MTYVGRLTGFTLPDDLTDDLLRDALCAFGDVSNMDRAALIKLWHEKDADMFSTVPELTLCDFREYRPDATFSE